MRIRELGVGMILAAGGAAALGQAAAGPAVGAGGPAFDIAVIRENKTATDGHTHVYQHLESGAYKAQNISLKNLLEYAYDLPARQIVEAPGWVDSLHFDIEAKSSLEVDAQMKTLSADEAKKLKQRMVRALLVERFGLKEEEVNRELPVYALVVTKGGVKFKEAQVDGRDVGFGIGATRGHVSDKGCEVAILADQLARAVGRPVVDRTGMTRRYDFEVQWRPDDVAPTDGSLPSVFTALQEQLGLRLEATKASVPVLLVEHVEMPSAN